TVNGPTGPVGSASASGSEDGPTARSLNPGTRLTSGQSNGPGPWLISARAPSGGSYKRYMVVWSISATTPKPVSRSCATGKFAGIRSPRSTSGATSRVPAGTRSVTFSPSSLTSTIASPVTLSTVPASGEVSTAGGAARTCAGSVITLMMSPRVTVTTVGDSACRSDPITGSRVPSVQPARAGNTIS